MRRLTSSLLVLVSACALAGADAASPPATARPLYRATSTHPFANVAHWQSIFDDPTRDAWQKPAKVVGALGLRPGMRVADLGAGTGYFSRYLSAAVGPQGAVLAVDTEPNLVVHLRERAEREASANLVPILASVDDPRLPSGALDLILLVDTFHHLDARLGYLQRLRKALRPGGRVAIIEWQKRDLPVGPGIDHKLARAQVVLEMESAHYELVEEPTILPYQYFLIFRGNTGSNRPARRQE